MTIDEAIERLQADLTDRRVLWYPKSKAATELGVEALKTIKAERTIYGFKRQVRLPGETILQ